MLFPEKIEDWIGADRVVHVADLIVYTFDLPHHGFALSAPEWTAGKGYHPSVLLMLFIYSCPNRILSRRWLEREAGR